MADGTVWKRVKEALNIFVDCLGVVGQALVGVSLTLATYAAKASTGTHATQLSVRWTWITLRVAAVMLLVNTAVVVLGKNTGRKIVGVVSYYASIIMIVAAALDDSGGRTPLEDLELSTVWTVGAVGLVSLSYGAYRLWEKCKERSIKAAEEAAKRAAASSTDGQGVDQGPRTS